MTISQTSAPLLRSPHFSRSTSAHPLLAKGRSSRHSPHNVKSIHPSMTWFTSCLRQPRLRQPRDHPIPLRHQKRFDLSISRSQSSRLHLPRLRPENLYLHTAQALIAQTLPLHILVPIANNLLRRQKRRLLRQNRRRLPKAINARRACSTWLQPGEVGGPHRHRRCLNHSSPRPHRPEKAKLKVPPMRITSGSRPLMIVSTYRLLPAHPERLLRYCHRRRRTPRAKARFLLQICLAPARSPCLPQDHPYSSPPPRLILAYPPEGLYRHPLSLRPS